MNSSKVKVLHVTFNMGIGGTEQVIRQIIENSDADKIIHEILCIDGTIGPLGIGLAEKGVHIKRVRRRPGTDFKLLQYMRGLIKQREINVIHCHQYTPYFYGVLASLWTKTTVIFTEHGRFYPDRHNFKRRLINPVLNFLTDYITAISESTADALAEYEYMPRGRVRVIYNGIKEIDMGEITRGDLLSDLGLSADYRYLGTISRLEPIKNQTMMINAYFKVKKKLPNVRLVLIGDGVKRQELKELARSLGIQNDVVFTGFIDNPQRYINIFEIFLLSSFSEGTSMTLLEAMSLSKPCIVTDVGGNPEIVKNEQTGRVVPSDDAGQFAEHIIELLKDKDVSKKYGVAAKVRYTEHYTVAKMVDSYHAMYLNK